MRVDKFLHATCVENAWIFHEISYFACVFTRHNDWTLQCKPETCEFLCFRCTTYCLSFKSMKDTCFPKESRRYFSKLSYRAFVSASVDAVCTGSIRHLWCHNSRFHHTLGYIGNALPLGSCRGRQTGEFHSGRADLSGTHFLAAL